MTKLEARTGEHSVPKLIHSIVYCLLRHLCCILLLYNSYGQDQRDAMAIIHQYTRNVDPQYILTTQCSHTHKSNCNLLNVVWNIKASPFNLKKKTSLDLGDYSVTFTKMCTSFLYLVIMNGLRLILAIFFLGTIQFCLWKTLTFQCISEKWYQLAKNSMLLYIRYSSLKVLGSSIIRLIMNTAFIISSFCFINLKIK